MDPDERATAGLRESKHKWEAEQAARGRACGRDWALELAEYVELRRLAENAPLLAELTELCPQEMPERIAGIAAGTGCDWRQFWEQAAGEDTEVTPPFAAGFILAVLEVWDEIEDQV